MAVVSVIEFAEHPDDYARVTFYLKKHQIGTSMVRVASGKARFTDNESIPPEVNPYNFAPLVSIPVLMLNGQYDYIFPSELSQKPLFQAIGSQDKSQIEYESTHSIPFDLALPAASEWLDAHLGPAVGDREK